MASLSQFQSEIGKSDVARQNRFEAQIMSPIGSMDYATSMLVESVEFPGQTIRSTPDLLRFGPQREVGQAVMYGDNVSMSFICRPGLPEKQFFERWHEKIFSRDTWEINYYGSYIGDIKLHQLDKKDGKRYTVEIFEAYPKTIVAQTYNQSSNDSYQTLSVQFAFRYWTSSVSGGGGVGGGLAGGVLGSGGGFNLGNLVGGAIGAYVSGGSSSLRDFAKGSALSAVKSMTGIGLTGFTKGAVKSALMGKAMGALMSGNVASIGGNILQTGSAKLASSGAWVNPDKVTKFHDPINADIARRIAAMPDKGTNISGNKVNTQRKGPPWGFSKGLAARDDPRHKDHGLPPGMFKN